MLNELTRQEIGTVLFLVFYVAWTFVAVKMFSEPKPGKHSFSKESVKTAFAAMRMLGK